MKSYVVDASVIVAWLLPAADEPLSMQAAMVEAAFSRNEIQLAAPDLIYPELGHVLRKAVSRGRISNQHAHEAADAIWTHNIPTFPARSLFALALAISEDYGASMYDATYVALGALTASPLITGDERLIRKIDTAYPILWLGDFSLAQ